MSSSLSKAARAHGCHGQTYLATVRTVTCQSTARCASRTVRRVGYAEAFTACYTSLMATAAILDATRKESKKRDLDRQLHDAKVRLERLQQESPAGGSSDGQVVSETPETDRKCTEALGIMESEVMLGEASKIRERDAQTQDVDQRLNEKTWGSYSSFPSTFADALGSLSPSKQEIIYHLCLWPREQRLAWLETREYRERYLSSLWAELGHEKDFRANIRGQTELDLENMEDTLRAETEDPVLLQREPVTEVQLSKALEMHVDLVDQLMAEVYSETRGPPALESGFYFIRMLKSDGYPRYRHATLSPEKAMEERQELCKANWTIFKAWKSGSRQTMVSKMCHNLLVCDFLPGVHAYNTLISGFTRLGETRLAEIVVDSFLLRSRLMVTRGTVLSLIHHYRLTQDPLGLQVFIRRMFGYDPRGLLVGRRSILQESNRGYLRHCAQTMDMNISKYWATLVYDADASVYQALLRALVDLRMLPEAARVFVICLQEQMSISAHLLDDMLQACIDHFALAAARVLVPAFLDHMDQMVSILSSEDLPIGLKGRLRRLIILTDCQMLPGEFPKGSMAVQRLEAANRLDIALTVGELEPYAELVKRDVHYVETVMRRALPIVDRVDLAMPPLQQLAKDHSGDLGFAMLAKRVWLEREVYRSLKVCTKRVFRVIDRTVPHSLRTFFEQNTEVDDLLQCLSRMLTPGSSLHRLYVLAHVCQVTKEELDQLVRDVLTMPGIGGSSEEATRMAWIQEMEQKEREDDMEREILRRLAAR